MSNSKTVIRSRHRLPHFIQKVDPWTYEFDFGYRIIEKPALDVFVTPESERVRLRVKLPQDVYQWSSFSDGCIAATLAECSHAPLLAFLVKHGLPDPTQKDFPQNIDLRPWEDRIEMFHHRDEQQLIKMQRWLRRKLALRRQT